MSNTFPFEVRTLGTLPTELLALVAENLDTHSLAQFAAASTVCLAVAHGELPSCVRRCWQLWSAAWDQAAGSAMLWRPARTSVFQTTWSSSRSAL